MHFVCNTLKINDRIFRSKIGAVGGRFEARFLPLVALVSLPLFFTHKGYDHYVCYATHLSSEWELLGCVARSAIRRTPSHCRVW